MYVGIDVSKNKSNVCILDNKQEIIREFSIDHTKEGFQELEKHLDTEMRIGMETTGNYCKIIYKYLKERYDVHYVDNVQMKTFARLNSPTIKNDKVDARSIAKFLCYDFKKIDPLRVDELKDMVHLHHKLINQLGRYKIMFKEQTNIIFPEIESISTISGALGIQCLLCKYPSPKFIVNATDEEIEETLLSKLDARGRYNQRFISYLKGLAINSVGVKDYPTTCYQYTAKILLFYHHLVEELKDKMLVKLMDTPYYRLLDISGYGIVSLSKIVGEVGDIMRFPTHKHFVSYCGLNVYEKQSGNTVFQNRQITKKGDKILRFTFYTLSLQNIRSNGAIKAFYEHLKSKGKHPKKAITACARKLAVWTYYEMLKCHEAVIV